MSESAVQIIRSCGLRTAGEDDAALVMAACMRLPGCAGPVSAGNLRVVEDIMRCSPIAGTIFVPMSFFRLSQCLHANQLYSAHMMAGCSLDAARNCVDAPLMVGIIDPHHRFKRVGSVALFRGMLENFRECIASVVVASPEAAEAVAGLMKSKKCSVTVSMDDRMVRSKFAQSRQYRVYIPRFSIDDTYDATDASAAVQKALDEAFEESGESHMYRRKPKEFSAQFYLMDPVIAAEVVQEVAPVKKASIMLFQAGDVVETVATNGFMGGMRGSVDSVVGDRVRVRFGDGRTVDYDMSQPISAASLRPVRRL